jgi:ribosomal protein L37AE/L43A
MRLAQDLDPMRPGLARAAMHPEVADRELGCASCHGAHAFERARAAVDACTQCHADAHTRSYAGTRHAQLFAAQLRGERPPGTGVSCATCHLPRVEREGAVTVQHDQNDNLRPNEKMIRTVCLDCHGLGFAIDALADPDLVARNFNGSPAHSVPSIEWAARRAE